MKKFACLLLACVGSLLQSNVSALDFGGWDVDFGIDTGYRHDDVHIRSAVAPTLLTLPTGVDATLTAFDANKWRDLESWTIGGYFRLNTCGNFYLRGCGEWGSIFHGRHQHFSATATTFTTTGEIVNALDTVIIGRGKVRGNVWDVDVAVGYNFHFYCDRFTLAPIMGWSYDQLQLNDHRFYGLETVSITRTNSTAILITGPIVGRAHHRIRWQGPFVGFDFGYQLDCNWTLLGGYEFHWANYRGHFKRDTVSTLALTTTPLATFVVDTPERINEHARRAYGNEAWLALEYTFQDDCWSGWTLGVSGNYKYWKTEKHGRADVVGTDFALVGLIAPLGTIDNRARLDHVKWTSWGIDLDLGFAF